MKYVVERWEGYPTTRREFINKFQLKESNLPMTLSSLTLQQEEFLKARILYHSKNGNGFRHLEGNAIDISVKRLNLDKKKELKKKIEKSGFKIIMEKPPSYNVGIKSATTFHVQIR